MPVYFTGPVGASTGVTGGYQGPADIVSGAVAWWGLRAYSAAYAAPGNNPCIDLFNNITPGSGTGYSGNPIKILSNGNVDTSAISAAIAGGFTFIDKVYDQTGNNHHFSSAGAAGRATITLTGGPLGNQPAIVYVTTLASALNATANVNVPFSFLVVGKRTDNIAGNAFPMLLNSSGQSIDYSPTNGVLRWDADGVNSINLSVVEGAFHIAIGTTDVGIANVYADSSSNTNSTPHTGANVASNYALGNTPADNAANGQIVEAGVWPVALTTGQVGNGTSSGLTANARTYWGF